MPRSRATGQFSKLPKHVGIMADANYPHPEWIENFILKVRPKTIICTTTGGGMEGMLERISVLRGDLYYKAFVSDPWETQIAGRGYATRLRDYLFIHYLKYNKGKLFIFLSHYETSVGLNYSRRLQDIIIIAHQNGVQYEFIRSDQEESDEN